MPTAAETFSGEITVASRIIDYLSSGLYATPAACLKELVNNSYDADAKNVRIFVKPDANRIIIEDDGEGMSLVEFRRHFAKVAESHKRSQGDVTKLGRPKIGKIGIGFIAANEICDVMEIRSTKSGSRELLVVEIDFGKMRLDPADRVRDESSYAKADYRGVLESAPVADHYTHIFLKEVKGEARRIFSGTARQSGSETRRSLYGLKAESVRKELSDTTLASWGEFDAYSETMLRVALNVPVRYFEDFIKSRKQLASVNEFVDRVSQLQFDVHYDGTDLRKPVVFNAPPSASFVHRFELNGESVSGSGYFYAQTGILKPQNLNGLLIRIRSAAVGDYDPSFLDYPSERGTLFQKWISGEIWASDELEEALNIDRITLRQTHPAVTELREMVHQELTDVIARARKELHGRSSQAKRTRIASEEAAKLTELTGELRIHSTALSESSERIEQSVVSRDESLTLSRKYSLSEIVSLVSDIANEVIPDARTRKRFLNAILDRLLEK